MEFSMKKNETQTQQQDADTAQGYKSFETSRQRMLQQGFYAFEGGGVHIYDPDD